jgi:glycosidase
MKKFKKTVSYLLIALFVLGMYSCNQRTDENQNAENVDSVKTAMQHPEWVKDAIIYEVNVRQFTKEGTFKAFQEHLPRLKELGVDILWFMPVHPIGVKGRKGKLGSYYSVKDYKGINPEFGTFDDFKSVVDKAHELGMYVIIDWVANHTAWDHPWTVSNPDFYTKDSLGNFVPPIGTDWSDVIDLNYENKNLWEAMNDALKFWVEKANIDGYRCDVADWVPMEYWEQARVELDKIKPVFMLAEAERPELHQKAFSASYAWEMHHLMHQIAKGEKDVNALDEYFNREAQKYDPNAIRMQFITNHDENSWNGTVKEKFGKAEKAFAVLTYTIPGMPLIYSGQEAGLDFRLKFFEKDLINWQKDKDLPVFYTNLNKLKKQNSVLWNGNNGAAIERIKTGSDSQVLAFVRQNKDNMVLVVMNLSAKTVTANLQTEVDFSALKNYFENSGFPGKSFNLKPWEYFVFVN